MCSPTQIDPLYNENMDTSSRCLTFLLVIFLLGCLAKVYPYEDPPLEGKPEWLPKHLSDCSEILILAGPRESESYWVNVMGISATYQCCDLMKQAIEHGADPDKLDGTSITALHIASRLNSIECMKTLIKQGANIDITTQDSLETPLMVASYIGHIDAVRLLLQEGASVDLQDISKNSALMMASANGHLPCVELLLEQKADINFQNEKGATALIAAILYSHEGVAQTLLDSKANYNLQFQDGRTALLAASQKGELKIITRLLDLGADINHQNDVNSSALLLAAHNNNPSIAKLLLDKGADCNLKDSSGYFSSGNGCL